MRIPLDLRCSFLLCTALFYSALLWLSFMQSLAFPQNSTGVRTRCDYGIRKFHSHITVGCLTGGMSSHQECIHPLCIALFYSALHCTALHCSVLHCTALFCSALLCPVLFCSALLCPVLRYSALHYSVLHCTALYCYAPHCHGWA